MHAEHDICFFRKTAHMESLKFTLWYSIDCDQSARPNYLFVKSFD